MTLAPVHPGIELVDLVPHALDSGSLGPGGLPLARVTPEDVPRTVVSLRAQGFDHLEMLTAQESEQGTLSMLYLLTRREDRSRIGVCADLNEPQPHLPSVSAFWSGAVPLEREVYDLFGVHFDGHPDLRRIVLRDDFVGHPLRRGFKLGENGVSDEEVQDALHSHGVATPAPGHLPLLDVSASASSSSATDLLVINMGPQHPSTHGVLHLWLGLDGERVIWAEPTHGYLHRCIEKLAEMRPYRAVTALLDRCDYVSGFHTELAYLLALEELAGIESTPKADHLRVLMCELVRITSHHTWLAAAGLDTGALTPFLYAFIDRERILDFFEEVTGARMMFNYFRPGGVKDDIPSGAASALLEYLEEFDRSVDEYEALLTGNEVFRARTRGVGLLRPDTIANHGVTGPMARASGVDIDLRRDAPYAAYDELQPHVALGQAGDTFDRYQVRIAEMRDSARIARDALLGMPEGPHVHPDAPRAIRPPVGAAYRSVESPRGELGVYVMSDGSDKPWRLKVRSPAFSNLHASPEMLEGCLFGDVVAVLGSVDVVMGEIDR